MQKIFTTLLFGMCTILCSVCSAGFQFEIEGLNATYTPGATGTFDIVLRITAPDTSPVSNIFGYSAAFQTNNSGANQGLSFTAGNHVPFANGGVNLANTNFTTTINGASTRVVMSNDTGGGTISVADGAILGRVNFSVGNSVLPNTVFTITTRTASNDFVDGTFNTLAGFTELGSASFMVVAVPEPSSLMLVGLVASGLVWRRRRSTAQV